MDMAQGPLGAELSQLDQLLQAKGVAGGGEFAIFALGMRHGARVAVNVLARRDPIPIAMLASELREFDDETKPASGRRMDMVPEAAARAAAEATVTTDALPAMTLNGDDNGGAADGRAEGGEGSAQRVRVRAGSRNAAQAADVPRSAGEGRAP